MSAVYDMDQGQTLGFEALNEIQQGYALAATQILVWGTPEDDSSGSSDDDDDGVLVETDTPMDKNVGQHGIILKIWRATRAPKLINKKAPVGGGPSPREIELAELWKIENVRNFNYAFRKYEEGIKADRTHKELLDILKSVCGRRA